MNFHLGLSLAGTAGWAALTLALYFLSGSHKYESFQSGLGSKRAEREHGSHEVTWFIQVLAAVRHPLTE